MGIVRMGPPDELVLILKRTLNLSTFIETGTFKGDTAVWASKHFSKVLTIEYSRKLFDEVADKYRHIQNIEFLFGDSRMVLSHILAGIREPVLFWIDAHWCGMDSYGENDQCPIIEELGIIRAAGVDHCILIDDARLFLSPPPLPNLIEWWPTIDLVCSTIQSDGSRYYILVFEDVVIAVPKRAQSPVAKYCQEHNTKAWNELGKSSVHKGLRLVKQGTHMIVQGIRSNLNRFVSA